ncbi:MAG TPA: hypothetical protein VFY14_03975 [Streptomyces sp.]|nr:hypothetical protein [Streptomyces sp.]
MKKLLREINVARGAHRLVPVLIRSTGVMCGAVGSWVRGEQNHKKNHKKKPRKEGEETPQNHKQKDAGETLGRALALAFVGYLLVYFSAPRPWTWAAWGTAWLIGCCIIAAARGDFADTGEQDTETPDTETPGEQDTKAPDETGETPGHETGRDATDTGGDVDRKAAFLRQHVEHAVALASLPGYADEHVQGKGVRVEDLLTGLQADGSLPGWDARRFRALLEGIGVPVREQMYFKVDGRKSNCPGVHVDDLTAALGRAPHLPAHLVPDLTPTAPTLSLVKEHQVEEVA